MQKLVELTQKELEAKVLHPLLIIAYFVVHFLAIHPFQDGNARLSRLLTTYLLLHTGYNYVPYSSLEHIIEKNKKAYYLALRQGQKNIRTKQKDLTTWIVFFLQALRQQTAVLENKLAIELKLRKLPELAEQILELVKQRGRVSNADIVQNYQVNRNTVKLQLSNLVLNGYLIKHGQGKGTWYTLNH